MISVEELSKTFKVPVRESGLKASVQSLFKREHRDVEAVKEVSFTIEPGEIVGFLGPNGAGKTTTLKMLSGLLYPTAGQVSVLGHQPDKREKAFLRRIALIMGNRNSMEWDLPAVDSFALNQAIYDVSDADFKARTDRFVEMLDAWSLINKPVRNLSLGERMKVEIIGALLHQPEVLFLDEPTIGLDVTMQKRIRKFVAEYRDETNAGVMLTSHYMADVVALCQRVIVIHEGGLLYDGDLQGLSDRFASHKIMTISVSGDLPDLAGYGTVVSSEGGKAVLNVLRDEISGVAGRILADLPVLDLSIEDPPIEDVIEQAFAIRDHD